MVFELQPICLLFVYWHYAASSGLTAAMKWIDAKQGRTDTTQAIGVPATLEDAVPQ